MFDSISNNCTNQFIANIIENMPLYESNPLNVIELLNASLFNDFNLDLLILNEKVFIFVLISLFELKFDCYC